MGKVSKWFRSLLNKHHRWKKDHTTSTTTTTTTTTSCSKCPNPSIHCNNINVAASPAILLPKNNNNIDQNKRVIAVAAATAAVADAAATAAQAAAVVVRLTTTGRSATGDQQLRRVYAAVKIQSAFRGYLARKALWALRGLVKLQALVRGHNERKRTAEWLRQMQAVVRAKAQATAIRAKFSESSHSHQPSPPIREKVDHGVLSNNTKYEQPSTLKRNGSKSRGTVIGDQDQSWSGGNPLEHNMDSSRDIQMHSVKFCLPNDKKMDKIVEMDHCKPHFTDKHGDIFQSAHLTTSKDSKPHQTNISPYSCEAGLLKPLKFSRVVAESPFYTADHSPQFYSASSKGGTSRRSPFTPTRSDGYSAYPNYMAYTESSRAKMRSISAPRQRPQFERSFSTMGNLGHGLGESTSNAQRITALQEKFKNKAYPGSCRLERMGTPIGYRY